MKTRLRGSWAVFAAAVAFLAYAAAPREAAALQGTTDYTVTAQTGLYEAPPANAEPVGGSAQFARVDLPFEFSYFGVLYDHVTVNVGSIMLFGNDTGAILTSGASISNAMPAAGEGACAPYWVCLQLTSMPNIKKWTAGTAPNRRFIVSWEKCAPYSGTGEFTYQVRLFEGSHRVEFAYKADTTPSTWQFNYTTGMTAPGLDDNRFIAPLNAQPGLNYGHPPSDWRFDPRLVTFSGRALYDRFTPTAAGLSQVTTQAPLARVDFEVRYSDGRRFGHGTTDADGGFQVTGMSGTGDPLSLFADVYIESESAACVVKAPAASFPYAQKITTSFYTNATLDVGTRIVDEAADPAAAFRGPANVACAVQRAADWIAARSSVVASKVAVTCDAASTAATSYSAIPSPAITIAGPAAVNPDVWDDAVVVRTYAPLVTAALAGIPPTIAGSVPAFDAATDDENAFAVAFGHFLAAATTGQSVFVDATGPSSAVTHDLEDPQPVTAKSPSVAAWVASALYDLLDPANETIDAVDGSGAAAARVVQAIDALASAPTAAKFLDSWTNLGFDGPGASRLWVGDGLVADDAFELNDSASESAAFGPIGTRKDGLMLTNGNEDWFDVVVPVAAPSVIAEVTFPRAATPATVELELLTAAGVRVADVVDNGAGPVVVTAGPLAAGTYRLRVAHVAGKRVPAYTLQASRRLLIDQAPLPDWTADRPYDQPIAVDGGVGATTFGIAVGTAPRGFFFDSPQGRVIGTPVDPGVFDFTVSVTDSGSPAHVHNSVQRVVINPPLAFAVGEFTPLALGKAASRPLPRTGGTDPLSVSSSSALPDGVSLSSSGLVLSGTPAAPGASPLSVHVVDAAGDSEDVETTAVVCVAAATPKTPADLATGDAACGFSFDAVAGSSVKISASTAPKRVKRALRAVLVGADGAVLAGSTAKPGTGKAAAAIAALPSTGRFFIVLASDSGEATQLLGSVTVAAPKSAKRAFDGVSGGDIVDFEFGALAGAKVSLKATAEKSSGLSLTVLALIGPNGAALPLGDIAGVKGTSAFLAATLPLAGTWKARVRAAGANSGTVSVSVKLGQPKHVTFVLD